MSEQSKKRAVVWPEIPGCYGNYKENDPECFDCSTKTGCKMYRDHPWGVQ